MARLKQSQTWFAALRLGFLDLMTLFVCGVISSELRNYPVPFLNFTLFDSLPVLVTCWIGLTIVGGYETKRDMCTLRYASEHILAMGAVLLFAFVVTYGFSTYNELVKPGRSALFLTLILFTPLSLAYRRVFSAKASREASARFIYVIGSAGFNANLNTICREASFRHPLRFLDYSAAPERSPKEPEDKNDGLNSLQKILSEPMNQCEGIVIDLSQVKVGPELEELLLRTNLHAVPVYPVESFIETYFHKIDLSHVSLSWALDGTFNADHHSAYGNLKILIDTAIATVLFVALFPLMIAAALVIKLSDSGPALFTQTRVGRFDRPFLLYKLRTMNVSSGENKNPYTQKNDPRITKVGRFLRMTRIDELPQLWNVLRGDMSLIGPRAEWDKLVERYKKEIPFYHLRSMVKPGITGWAQVNYGYGADLKDTLEKLQYDLYYIKHYSPQMDASIILKTLFTILSASGR